MNLIFDFDGTICNSFSKSVSIANKYARPLNLRQVTEKEVKKSGVKGIIKELKFTKLQVLKFILYYRRQMEKEIPLLRIYPGLAPVLRKLAEKNKLYIVSSNSKINIKNFLSNNGLDNHFATIDDSNDFFGKNNKISKLLFKYHLSIGETYYIGDEIRDIEAAKKAGVHSVAVSWGYDTKQILKEAGPDKIIDDPKDLLVLV